MTKLNCLFSGINFIPGFNLNKVVVAKTPLTSYLKIHSFKKERRSKSFFKFFNRKM